MPSEITVDVSPTRHIVFSVDKAILHVKHHLNTKSHEIPLRQVVNASFHAESGILRVAYLHKHKKKYHSMIVIKGTVKAENDVVQLWAESLMRSAYDDIGVKPHRRLKVLVNPYGGTKKGVALFIKVVEPILREAGCYLDVKHTTHQGHAREIAKSLPLEYDAIVTVSGDGLVHEVINGLAQHTDPARAFATPVAPIPTGSGNGLSLNLLGIHDGFDVAAAALNVLKGRPMKTDLFSFTQNGERRISFMSQALGLMADLDIGTESWRWMGDARFMVGFLRGLIKNKPCPVQLSFKVAESDKEKMAENVHERRKLDKGDPLRLLPPAASEYSTMNTLPPLKHLPEDEDGWTTFNGPMLYIYAGKGPYVGRDLMAFPVSLPDDGLIDLMVMPVSSRKEMLDTISGAEKGDSYWHPKLHYVKAHAYRVKPLKPTGWLSVDGEAFPFQEFQVEVLQSLGTLLSSHGHYAAEFSPRSATAGVGKGKKSSA